MVGMGRVDVNSRLSNRVNKLIAVAGFHTERGHNNYHLTPTHPHFPPTPHPHSTHPHLPPTPHPHTLTFHPHSDTVTADLLVKIEHVAAIIACTGLCESIVDLARQQSVVLEPLHCDVAALNVEASTEQWCGGIRVAWSGECL